MREIVHFKACEIRALRRRWVGRAAAFFACLAFAFFVSVIAAAPTFAQCLQSGSIVTCTGISSGFQAGGGVDGLTVNVQTGAVVDNPGNIAIGVNDLNAVTNNGAISAGDDGTGISAGNNNTITNAATGTITVGDAVSAPAVGIFVLDNNTVLNLGTIQVGTSCGCLPAGGIMAGNGNTITNAGSITGGDFAFGILGGDGNTITNSGAISMGLGGAGITAGDNNTITNAAGGIITVGDSPSVGAAGIAVQNNNTVVNLGTIQVGSTLGPFFPAAGILANNDNTITNVGSIIGGDFTFGIFAEDNNTITNRGRITMGQDGFGIVAENNNTITNAVGGIITVGDAVNVAAYGITAGNNNIITNLGQIIVGQDGAGISAGDGNTIINAVGGAITVGDAVNVGSVGIAVLDNNIVANLGTITVGSSCG